MIVTTWDELWKYPAGTHVTVMDKECKLRKLRGVYLGRDAYHTEMFWDEDKGYAVYGDNDKYEDDDMIFVQGNEIDVKRVYTCKVASVMALVQDGWRIGAKGLDIGDHIDELRVYAEVLEIDNKVKRYG
jgi:hypothetical protein